MASMKNVSLQLKVAELKKDNLRKTLENFQSQSSSILVLNLQWKDLEDHFDSIQKSIAELSEVVNSKEKHLDSLQKSIEENKKEVQLLRRSVEERSTEVELKEKKLELMQKTLQEFADEVGRKNEEFEEFRRLVEERSREVESKEKRLDSVQNSIEERSREVELKEKECALLRRSVEEQSEEVELKQEQFDSIQKAVEERRKEVELRENKCALFQRSLEERSVEIEKGSKEVESTAEQVGSVRKSNEQRFKELESKEKRLDSKKISTEECWKEVEFKEQQFDSMKRPNEELCKEVELKEKRLNSIQKSIEECGKELKLKEEQFKKSNEKHSEELELKEKQLNSIQKSTEECCKELELKGKQLDSIRETIQECLKELESKEKHLDSIQKSIEKCSEELELKDKQFNLMQKTNEQCLKELEFKEEQFKSNQKSIEERAKELESKEKQIYTIQKSMEERTKELELKERQLTKILNSQVKIEPSELVPVDNATNFSSANLRFCITMDGRSLQLFLNKKVNVHELMHGEVSIALRMSSDPAKLVLDAIQGFYPPHLKEGDIEFEASVVRRSCILLLEQLMEVSPQIRPHVKEEALKVADEWKAKMRAEADNSLEVLGFLQLLATYGLAAAFDSDELRHLLEIVRENRQAPDLCRVLGIELAEMIPMSGTHHSQVKNDQPESSQINYADQLLPNELMNSQNLILDKVSASLRMSSDPAKVVLDALQGFCSPQLKKGDMVFEERVIRSCILLLEQLMRISPEIKPQVKEEAIKLAFEWKAKTRAHSEDSLGVLGFLHLLAAYGLVSSFNGDEVLILFKTVAHHNEAPKLCRALGFADKISDYIKSLVEKNHRLKAIKYVCAFELGDRFPPVPLLETHLKFRKNVANKICYKKRDSCVALDEAADNEIASLSAIIKCTKDCRLESQYPLKKIERRIVLLEKQKAKRKLVEPAPAPKVQPLQKSGNKRCKKASSAEPSPNPSVGTSSVTCLAQPPSA